VGDTGTPKSLSAPRNPRGAIQRSDGPRALAYARHFGTERKAIRHGRKGVRHAPEPWQGPPGAGRLDANLSAAAVGDGLRYLDGL
jgi:hypothetical protein